MHHIVFFEATVFGVPVLPGFTTDANIVFAPHNYGESIGDIPIDGLFGYYANLAKGYGTAMWTGEYGWFGDPTDERDEARAFRADRRLDDHCGRDVVAVASGLR